MLLVILSTKIEIVQNAYFSMFLFSDFEPVSLRWVIILSIGGGILLIILSTILYCWIRRKNAARIRSENNRRQANYRPGTSSSGRRGNNSDARNSSAQDRDSSINERYGYYISPSIIRRSSTSSLHYQTNIEKLPMSCR